MKRNKNVDKLTATGYARREALDTKHGMTLNEMEEFVKAARRQRIAGNTGVRITATWRSSAKVLEIEGPVFPGAVTLADEQ